MAVRRTIGTAQKGKSPLLTLDLRKILVHLPDGVRGLRDRALLLVGFAGAFRRSELAALDIDQVRFTPDGLVIRLQRSKTNQEGEDEPVAIPCGFSSRDLSGPGSEEVDRGGPNPQGGSVTRGQSSWQGIEEAAARGFNRRHREASRESL